jgi:hypothetical protein
MHKRQTHKVLTDNALRKGDDAEIGDRGDNNIGERSGRFAEATSAGTDGEKSEDGENIDEVREYTGDAMLDAGDARENLEK